MTATELNLPDGENNYGHISRKSTPEEVAALVYGRYGPILRRFAASMLNNNWDRAEDILQETAIRAWMQAKRRPNADMRLYAWLRTVVRNLVIDDHRARHVRPRTVEMTEEVLVFQAVDQVEQVINRTAITEALEELSLPHQEILRHVYLQDRSILEVAQELAIPPGTVKSRTHHALRALRSALATCDEDAL